MDVSPEHDEYHFIIGFRSSLRERRQLAIFLAINRWNDFAINQQPHGVRKENVSNDKNPWVLSPSFV